MRKIIRRTLAALLIVTSLLTAAIVGAAVQIFEGTGQYIMSDDLDHEFGKKRAQQRAERDAQKKAGVALKTFSRSINSELADNEVSAVVNNIIQVSDVKIVPVPFEAEGEAGIIYRATLKATIDTDGIYSWIKRDDKEKVTIIQQNTNLQDAIQKNDELAESLTEQYMQAKTQAEKDKLRKQMNDADRDFLANQKFEEALKLYYAKDYNGSIKLNTEAIELNPNEADAYNNRGTAYRHLNQYERAIQDYNKAIQLNPNYATAYYNRGLTYYDLKQYERAIQDLNKAIQLNPNDALAYNNRGTIYDFLGQYELAISDLNKAIQLDPNLAEAYSNRGIVYFELGQFDSAIQDFNKGIQLNPNLAEPYSNRGCIYMDAFQQYERAIQDFNKALKIDPTYAFAYGNRGLAYYHLKNYKQAFSDLNKSLELCPDEEVLGEAFYYRGLCYQQFGEKAKAQADFAKAKALGYKG